jgi:hypothetical protein
LLSETNHRETAQAKQSRNVIKTTGPSEGGNTVRKCHEVLRKILSSRLEEMELQL